MSLRTKAKLFMMVSFLIFCMGLLTTLESFYRLKSGKDDSGTWTFCLIVGFALLYMSIQLLGRSIYYKSTLKMRKAFKKKNHQEKSTFTGVEKLEIQKRSVKK
ncbi:MAG: hypothetical protein ACRCVT_10025 [Leadbetterella sp.]